MTTKKMFHVLQQGQPGFGDLLHLSLDPMEQDVPNDAPQSGFYYFKDGPIFELTVIAKDAEDAYGFLMSQEGAIAQPQMDCNRFKYMVMSAWA